MSTIATKLQKAETGPTPADWARYVKLLRKAKPTERDQDELVDLCAKLGINSAKQVELHQLILSAADRTETELDTEPEARRTETEMFAKFTAERERLTKLLREITDNLMKNNHAYAAEYNEAREQVRLLMHRAGELSTMRARWPGLFGLPLDTKRLSSESLPDDVHRALTQYQATLS